MLGVLKGCSNYHIFLLKKSLRGKYWRKKIEIFNIPLVEFQGVILCVAAFWVKRNTALRTYKSSFTLDIFPHTHSTASCWCFVTDLLNQHQVYMCCNQQPINVFPLFALTVCLCPLILQQCEELKPRLREAYLEGRVEIHAVSYKKSPLLSSTF
jgi:hypothetical protein